MRVGCNYPWPWNAYGTFFGNAGLASWTSGLDDNLGRLSELGVSVVRIFLVGNAWMYGRLEDGAFTPSDPGPAGPEQLEQMLAAFKRRGMVAIPSLLDFKALMGPAGSKGYGGRGAIASDPAVRDRFFEVVLEPLLRASECYRDAVYAWEVMNEPVWCTINPFAKVSYAIPTFLEGAIARVTAHGFASTVGHRFARDLDRLPTGSVRQFHYYPQRGLRAWLPFTEQPLADQKSTRAILGEFATRVDGSQGDLWPELAPDVQRDPRRAVFERLRIAEARGYDLALVWPDLEGVPFGSPDTLKLSAGVQDGIRDYAGALASAAASAKAVA